MMRSNGNSRCALCGREAAVALRLETKGKVWRFPLCEAHAEALQDLSNSLGAQEREEEKVREESRGKSCPECGITLREVRQRRLFGCAACYDTFRDLLPFGLTSKKHVGKAPRASITRDLFERQISYWNDRMSRAVKSESYEDAAECRDRISDLRQHFPQFWDKDAAVDN